MKRTALITGAAQRIGAAIARTLHRRGCRVVLHYRSSMAAAESLAAELNAKREDSARCIQADLAAAGAAAELAAAAGACWSGLHILVNNAAQFRPTPLGRMTEEEWEQLMASNLKGAALLCQAAAPALRTARGAVVNLSDVYARSGLREHTAYCVTKGGLEALTRALALELAPEVRVNSVAPGAILPPAGAASDAAMQIRGIALGRWGTAEEIAQAVAFLAENATYMTGQVVPVDGGKHLQGWAVNS